MLTAFEPFTDFRVASDAVLRYLRDQFGFMLWMVTRTEGNDWIVLQAEDHGYGVKEGDVFRWTDSFCWQMVQANGPCIAPRSNLVPAYAAAPIGQQVPIAAYVGLPLTKPDGSLFGTLCAIDPEAQNESLCDQLPQFEMISRMLSTVLATEIRAEEETRRAERADVAAETDTLTGLINHRGWDRLLAFEEDRCRRFGHAASIFTVELAESQENVAHPEHFRRQDMLRTAASVLTNETRESDVVARIGGSEFTILAVHCDQQQSAAIIARIHSALAGVGLRASLGVAQRNPAFSLAHAWNAADQNMYTSVRARGSSNWTAPLSSAATR